jgi:hypothetical protein
MCSIFFMGSDQTLTLRAILGDVFSHRDAAESNVSDRRLYALRDDGAVVALGGGIYRWADAPVADLDLIEIAERVPRATLCLETALARYDLIGTIPAATDIAISRGAHRPKLRAAVRLHVFDPTTFDIGRDTIDVSARQPLGIYSSERSLIDVIRLRHDQGTDIAWEALRRWLTTRGHSPAQLLRMASNFKGAEAPLRKAFEVLL